MKKKIVILIQTGLFIVSILAGSSLAEFSEGIKSVTEDRNILDMETAGRIALKNNPSIQAIKERLNQAEEDVKQ